MSERIQAIRGMNDVLPDESYKWHYLETVFSQCFNQYGYKEIRTPILESTQLYKRTIGEVTDIVEKEMYTFADLNGDNLTLRPEGTAGCVRACLEHGLLHNQQQKLWYRGPMFRHEKPQKGRYRQFNQCGVEVFGIPGVNIELELIAMCRHLWRALNIENAVFLQLNTLGDAEERGIYREQLIDYFKLHYDELDEDSKRRLERNPLRILDSKNPKIQAIIENAPKLIDTVSEKSKNHFTALCDGLDTIGIPYTINPLLVRGLDYYGHTVFEWVTDKLGAQSTVCAGGRFDTLVEQLGGKPTPAIGFALGIERLLLLRESLSLPPLEEPSPQIFFIAMSDEGIKQAMVLAEQLREQNPRWRILVNLIGGSFKSQFKKADKSGARLALILGDEEISQQMISVKDLRENEEQTTLPQHELISFIKALELL